MTRTMRRKALEHLSAVDAELVATAGRMRSLDPQREWGSSLRALAEVLLHRDIDDRCAEAFADALSEIARSLVHNFPGNLLWDLDRLAASLLEPDEHGDLSPETIRARQRRIGTLGELFGVHGPIRFRYVHDFIYGFDWAKWVKRDKGAREGRGPFDGMFLDYLLRRGREITTLIERHDARYPRLDDGDTRNPFPFSREPPDEMMLFSALARNDQLPLQAWNIEAAGSWREPFDELRIEEAKRLGLIRSSAIGRRDGQPEV